MGILYGDMVVDDVSGILRVEEVQTNKVAKVLNEHETCKGVALTLNYLRDVECFTLLPIAINKQRNGNIVPSAAVVPTSSC